MTAPVTAHAEIDIAADERAVWTVIADIASWPTWNPAVRHAHFDAELDRGATFRYSTSSGAMRCEVTEVDAPHRLAWTARLMTVRQHEFWRVEPTEAGVHFVVDATLTGLGARIFRTRLHRRLQGELDSLVQLLKLEAEVRTIEEREDEERGISADG